MSASPSGAGKPDKTMSSRLLTMKFMQRAAASKVAKEAEKDEQTENDEENTRKRARNPSDRRSGAQADLDAMSAAMAEAEQKQREAMSDKAAAAGESHWTFNYPPATLPQQIVGDYIMGANSLDADENMGGRRGFGGYVRKQKASAMTEEEIQEARLARITKEVDELVDEGSIPRRQRDKQIQARMDGSVSTKNIKSISGGRGGGGGFKDMGSSGQKKKRKSGE